MKDQQFLLWLEERLVHVYGESDMTDFVQKLHSIAVLTDKDQDTRIGEEEDD